MKSVYIFFSILLLIYMLWPEPSKISQFPSLPNGLTSTLSGDTVQIPNVSAYFSHNFRNFVIPFYLKSYQQNSYLPFPPLRLNHPPEYSWTVIKKPTDTTYIEEFLYPLKSSLYVNGFEAKRPDGSLIFWGAPPLDEGGQDWSTKVTLRLYTSSIITRFIVWFGIVISISSIYKLAWKVIKE